MARKRSSRKPQPGVCGTCGCAVVQPSTAEKWSAAGEFGGCWERPIAETGWASGHHFDDSGNLLKVLCRAHGGFGWPAETVTTDATVPMG